MDYANRKSGILAATLLCILAMMLPTIAFAANGIVRTGTVGVSIASDSAMKTPLDAYRLIDTTYKVKEGDLTESDVAYPSETARDAVVDALGKLDGGTGDVTAYDALSKLEKAQDDDSTRVASVLARSAIDAGLVPSATVPSDGDRVEIENGLYVLVPHDASGTGTGTLDSSTPIMCLFDGVSDSAISEKSSAPSIDKTVNGAKVLAAGMDETLSYDVSITLPENYDAFGKYPIVVEDTLDNGLTLDEGSVALSDDDGKPVTQGSGAYTVSASKSDDGKTVLTVSADDAKAVVPLLSSSRHLHVTYTATLNADAVTGTDNPNENSVAFSYQRSPYDTTMVTSVTSITKTLTAYLDITKVDYDTKGSLNGARLALRRVSDGKWWNGSEWSDDQADFQADGEVTLPSIGSGKYELSETHAPDGYDAISGNETIDVAMSADDDGKLSLDVTVSSSDGLVSVASSDAQTGKASIIVSDQKASASPAIRQTGDRTVTTIAAVALAAAVVAVIVIVVRKGRN